MQKDIMIHWLEIARQLGVKYLETYEDFKLIINQIEEEYKVKYNNIYTLIPCNDQNS